MRKKFKKDHKIRKGREKKRKTNIMKICTMKRDYENHKENYYL